MALAAAITDQATYDSLSEAIKAEYKKEGNIFLLDVTQTEVEIDDKKRVYGMEDVHGLKKGLNDERTSTTDLKKQLKRFEKIKDPDEAIAAMAKIVAMGKEPDVEAKMKAQIETVKKQYEEKHKVELDGRDEKYSAMSKKFDRMVIHDSALTELSNHELVKGGSKFLLLAIKQQTRVVENEDGSREARVVDPSGDGTTYKTAIATGKTGFMGIGELVDSMSKDEEYAALFAGSGISGGDNTGVKTGPAVTKTPQTKGGTDKPLSATEIMKQARGKDRESKQI